jgi:hypothetical protein
MQGALSVPGGHHRYGSRVKGAVSCLLAHFALFVIDRVLTRVIDMVAWSLITRVIVMVA